jgi:hypothetical protein
MPVLKRHSTWPYLEFAFTDADGPINCTIYKVRMVVKDKAGAIKINTIVGEVGSAAVWDNEATGTGHYKWLPDDVDTTGQFFYEFKFELIADPTQKFSIPLKDFYDYSIIEDIEIPES